MTMDKFRTVLEKTEIGLKGLTIPIIVSCIIAFIVILIIQLRAPVSMLWGEFFEMYATAVVVAATVIALLVFTIELILAFRK